MRRTFNRAIEWTKRRPSALDSKNHFAIGVAATWVIGQSRDSTANHLFIFDIYIYVYIYIGTFARFVSAFALH